MQGFRDGDDDLYTQLWHACAGPSVHIPTVGEKVFYFPQGHMEQVKPFTSQDGKMEIPLYNLPSKILCKVVNVQLRAEADTDEVFAEITLLPVPKSCLDSSQQDGQSLVGETSLPLPRRAHVRWFSKKLTASDSEKYGGIIIRKEHADECLPPMDMSQQPPVRELIAEDLHGFKWNFRHIFRGQPKRHLLTGGWSRFTSSKRLLVGDEFIFLRGENGKNRVGIRRASVQNNASTGVISGHSIQHGIFASVAHAMSAGSIFVVYHRPWTSPSEFIIPYGQYTKSADYNYSVGMRIRKKSERRTGTVVAIEDIDCIRWPGSEWRCLKVQWDSTSSTLQHLERVSPWDIEPKEFTHKKHTSILRQPKRARTVDPSSSGFAISVRDGLSQSSRECTSQMLSRNQDYTSHESRSSPHLALPPNPSQGHSLMVFETQMHSPMLGSSCSSRTISGPGGIADSLELSNSRPPTITSHGERSSIFFPSVNSSGHGPQERRASEQNDDNEAHVAQTNGSRSVMLFGVNIANSAAPAKP